MEKSTEQHSATSVTEQGRPHLSRHDNSRARVGSASALRISGSSSRSNRARRRTACFGLGEECWNADVMMQVLCPPSAPSNLRIENWHESAFSGPDQWYQGINGSSIETAIRMMITHSSTSSRFVAVESDIF